MDFNSADRLFKAEQIQKLGETVAGRRYLKLRSLSRGEYLTALLDRAGFILGRPAAKETFRYAFDSTLTDTQIDKFIADRYQEDRIGRKELESTLVNELYKLEVFDWGGLHQNSLEKTIVDNYVKKIAKYDDLEKAIEGELHSSMRGYVLCSWYNHWTSILIEDIFRDHSNVIPALGQVKKIDFFVKGVPFDLKVTSLPEGYIAVKRKEQNLKPELTLLRGLARQHHIPFDKEMPNGRLLDDLWKKVSDHPDKQCAAELRGIKTYRAQLIDELRADPSELIVWLYENQGIRRFDASNRLFLVIVDTNDYFGSWKLKRALPLLRTNINGYLDGVSKNPGRKITFDWEGESYSTLADIVLVTKP
ncbi:MAG: hypothetical protein JW384_02142 [Nitrosomonadaceae bacterium]|nr:hypothetical protein [Nitrosomonadaceae bacterium]